MNWDDMALVGAIARPHGIRGQVIVNVETDFPDERFQSGSELFVDRRGVVQPLTLTTVRFHQGRPIVGIVGVDSIDEAQRLAGLELRVPAERLARLPAGTFYRHDLVGCQVETSGGRAVGIVSSVEGTIEMSRLVVASEGEEILIPLTDAICTGIDVAAKRILVEPPDGLLELNKKGNHTGNGRLNHKAHKDHIEE